MTTGKTIERRYSEGALTLDEGAAIIVERQHLEREVIEKVKRLRKAELAARMPSDFDVVEAQRALRTTTDALLAFEAEQK